MSENFQSTNCQLKKDKIMEKFSPFFLKYFRKTPKFVAVQLNNLAKTKTFRRSSTKKRECIDGVTNQIKYSELSSKIDWRKKKHTE